MIEVANLYNILGGNIHDNKNNVLKSLFIVNVANGTVEIEAEPYDDAYNLNDVDATIDKICRLLDKREKSIFKSLARYYQTDIERLEITFFDDMSVCGGAIKILGEKCEKAS